MRQVARSLGRLWNEASPRFRGFIAVLSFFGIGKFVAEWFGGAVIIPYWGSLEKPALVAIGLSLGMVVGVWLRVRKGRVVEALRTQTYRHVITADVYREIGTIANSIVRRALDSPNWVVENWVGDKDVHNRLISLLERVKWLLGEKVYNHSCPN